MASKVFVTGGDGLLGSNLVRLLLEKGYVVTVLVHPSSQSDTLQDLDISVIKGDILRLENLVKAIKNHDYVVHGAAMTDVYPNKHPRLWKVNVDGTQNVIDACKRNHIKRLIYIGTANCFKYGTLENPGNELKVCTVDDFGIDYIRSKIVAHQKILNANKNGYFEAISIHPTFMVGAYDSGPSSGKMLLALANRKLPGYSNGGKNYVYVRDVAHAVANALTMGRAGEAYIAGNENLTYKAMFQRMAQILDVPAPRLKMGSVVILGFGMMNTLFAKLTGGVPSLSYEMAKIGLIGNYYSARKAVEELKMPQTDLDLAIKESYEWFKEHNYC